jgi:DNA-binding NtrC family response regulator
MTPFLRRTGASEAIHITSEKQVDAVLADISGGHSDGFAILENIAGMRPKPPVIVLAVGNEIKTAVTAMKLGAPDCQVNSSGTQAVKRLLSRVLEEGCPAEVGVPCGEISHVAK